MSAPHRCRLMVVVVSEEDCDRWTANLAELLRSLSLDVALVAGPAALASVAAEINGHAAAPAVHGDHASPAGALSQLTPTEKRTLLALVNGDSAEDVAIRTGTSITTVRTHIRNVLSKLGVHSQRQAIALAVRAGWTAVWNGEHVRSVGVR